MGCEFAQQREWSHDRQLDWWLLDDPSNRGAQHLVRDLNHLYRKEPALHESDCKPGGFRWVVGDDRANSVFAYLRMSEVGRPALIVCNMTPLPRYHYRMGVPHRRPLDRSTQFGTLARTAAATSAMAARLLHSAIPSHGLEASIEVTLPPLAAVIFLLDNPPS